MSFEFTKIKTYFSKAFWKSQNVAGVAMEKWSSHTQCPITNLRKSFCYQTWVSCFDRTLYTCHIRFLQRKKNVGPTGIVIAINYDVWKIIEIQRHIRMTPKNSGFTTKRRRSFHVIATVQWNTGGWNIGQVCSEIE